jgi:hypothetical protein
MLFNQGEHKARFSAGVIPGRISQADQCRSLGQFVAVTQELFEILPAIKHAVYDNGRVGRIDGKSNRHPPCISENAQVRVDVVALGPSFRKSFQCSAAGDDAIDKMARSDFAAVVGDICVKRRKLVRGPCRKIDDAGRHFLAFARA